VGLGQFGVQLHGLVQHGHGLVHAFAALAQEDRGHLGEGLLGRVGLVGHLLQARKDGPGQGADLGGEQGRGRAPVSRRRQPPDLGQGAVQPLVAFPERGGLLENHGIGGAQFGQAAAQKASGRAGGLALDPARDDRLLGLGQQAVLFGLKGVDAGQHGVGIGHVQGLNPAGKLQGLVVGFGGLGHLGQEVLPEGRFLGGLRQGFVRLQVFLVAIAGRLDVRVLRVAALGVQGRGEQRAQGLVDGAELGLHGREMLHRGELLLAQHAHVVRQAGYLQHAHAAHGQGDAGHQEKAAEQFDAELEILHDPSPCVIRRFPVDRPGNRPVAHASRRWRILVNDSLFFLFGTI
jgi:hypothetical protein